MTNKNNKKKSTLRLALHNCTKTLLHNLYLLAKASLLSFKKGAGQVKVKLRATISNGFYVIRFKQFYLKNHLMTKSICSGLTLLLGI